MVQEMLSEQSKASHISVCKTKSRVDAVEAAYCQETPPYLIPVSFHRVRLLHRYSMLDELMDDMT